MDPAGFQCIYPSYLDSTKSLNKGRRIGAEKAVPNPTVSDISYVLQTLNIRHVLQPNKGYSRDIETLWDNPGRVLYEPPTDDDYTKRRLLLDIASKIEAVPSRMQRLEQEKIQAEMERKKEEEAASRERQAHRQIQAQQSAKSGKSNKKIKGKKKR